MSATATLLENNNFKNWRWVPLLTPAVKKGFCEVDYNLLHQRVYALGVLVIIGFIVTMNLTTPIPFILLALGTVVTVSLDWWLAERAANVKAVNEYLKEEDYPSDSATFRIQHNLSAAQLLVEKDKNLLNKINENGKRLIDNTPTFEFFAFLVNNEATLLKSDFKKAVSNKDPAYLFHLLKESKFKADDFSPLEQIELWGMIGNQISGQLLKEYGFNVNITDHNGQTPLLNLLSKRRAFNISGSLGIEAKIAALIKCGANTLPMSVKDAEGNLVEVDPISHAKREGVKNILAQAQEKARANSSRVIGE